jgi:hypothetical protein
MISIAHLIIFKISRLGPKETHTDSIVKGIVTCGI